MQYEIEISGGFAGTVQQYKGELTLAEEEKKALIRVFNNATLRDVNKDLRDAFVYTFKLKMDNKSYKATFNDGTIPIELLSLLNKVKVR